MIHPPAIGLDIGTSGVKALFLGSDNRTHLAQAEYGKGDGAGKLNPKTVFDAVLSALSQLPERTHERAVCVGICSAVPSLLALDSSGEPVTEIYTWEDLSGNEYSGHYFRDPSDAEAYFRKTGCPVQAFYPIWKIMFLREKRPELFSRASKFVSVGEYVFHRLSRTPAISFSSASAFGLLDIHRGKWDAELLEFSGIGENGLFSLSQGEMFPVSFHDLRGISAIAENAMIKPAVGENVSAHFGVGGAEVGVLSSTIGTAGALRVTLGKPVMAPRARNWCSLVEDQKWVAGNAINAGGNCLFWLKDVFGIQENDFLGVVDNIAFENEDYPLFLPFLYGEKSPGWHENMTGAFLNVKASHSRDAFLKSVMEGTVFNLFDCYNRLREGGIVVSDIRAAGGFCYFPYWVQLLADIFQSPINLANISEPAAFGAALGALKTLYPDVDVGPRAERIFAPNDSKRSYYLEKFAAYQKAYNYLAAQTDK
ncbi:MAG: hypothetical protein HZA02_00475 [Nitrospinae bacterium]|nr:hypothetical protein [Nitrospinota bacterium]